MKRIKYFALILVLLGSCGIPMPVIDTTYRDILRDFSWYTLNDTVYVIGGHHTQVFWISETHQLFQGPRTRTGSRDIDSKKVYFSTDTAFIFQLHNSNNFGEYTTSISQWKLKEIKTKLNNKSVFRAPQYYAELNGAVYCVAGEGSFYYPADERHYQDVWKTVDGCNWERILESGPWGDGFGTMNGHQLFVFGGRIWLYGGYRDGQNLKDLWSSLDGVSWTKEKVFFDPDKITQLVSFKDELYIVAHDIWKLNAQGEFIKQSDFPFKLMTSDAKFIEINRKLYAVSSSGIYVTDDCISWRELFNTYSFFSEFGVSGNKIIGVERITNGGKRAWESSDGIHWSAVQDTISIDFFPSMDVSMNDYLDEGKVVEFRDELWLFTGHPDLTWKSKDGLKWQKVDIDANNRFVPRIDFASVVFQDRIWILGGRQDKIDGNISNNEIILYLNDVWSSSDGRSWRKEVNAPWFMRSNSHSIVRNGQLYLIGGSGAGLNKLDIWKTSDGKIWVEIDMPKDLVKFNSLRPSLLGLIMYDNSMWFFDPYLGTDVYSLNALGEWNHHLFADNEYYRNPNLDKLALLTTRGGEQTVYALSQYPYKLYSSNTILQWSEVPFTLKRIANEMPYIDYAKLLSFHNNLYLWQLKDGVPESVLLEIGE